MAQSDHPFTHSGRTWTASRPTWILPIALGLATWAASTAVPVLAAPELLYDLVVSGSNLTDAVKNGSVWYMETKGPDFGVAAFDPGANTWMSIDAPPFENGTSKPDVAGGFVFFRGEPIEGDGLMHLYRVDGSGSIELGATSELSAGGPVKEVAGIAIFPFADETNGYELWTTDGTPEGTEMLLDINPTGDSDPAMGVSVGGFHYFSANDGVNGWELWKTNGTPGGTSMVKDIRPGSSSSSLSSFAELGGIVYFAADDGVAGSELWRSDGTLAGTYLVTDIFAGSPSSSPSGLTAIGSWVYFSAYALGSGRELYRSNGTVTEMVADIWAGSEWSSPEGFTEFDNEIYFSADDGVHGKEIWKTNGTLAGTELVFDCDPGTDWSMSSLKAMTAAGVLFFRAGNGSGDSIWRTEGTNATTAPVFTDASFFPDLLFATPNFLYFAGDDGSGIGSEPHRIEVATNTIQLVHDLNTEDGLSPEHLTPYGDDLIGFADHYWFGRDLWKFDLTAPETSLPIDLTGWRDTQAPVGATFAVDGNNVFFSGRRNDTGFEVGAYDGTNVYQLDVIPGPDGSDPREMVVANGHAFFVALTGSGNYGIYTMSAPPTPVLTLLHEFGTEPPRYLTPLGNGVLFAAEDDGGVELWRATTSQAARLIDINPGPGASNPASLTVMNDRVYFSALQPGTGRELWVSNGTPEGTHLVEEIEPGSNGSNPSQLIDGYPFLYLTAGTAAAGVEIYRATEFGIDAADEIVLGPGSADPQELAFAGSRLRFSADDGSGIGREPWSLVGATPTLTQDLNPGAASSNPKDFTSHLGATYFTATNATTGRELYRVAGGAVSVVSDPIAPGAISSLPGDRATVGTRLYFAAENEEFGREIWYVDDAGGPSDVPSVPSLAAEDALRLRTGPNPFGNSLQLGFALPYPAEVQIQLIDAGGRMVEQIALGHRDAGEHRFEWSLEQGAAIPNGILFVRLEAAGETRVRKVLRIK